MGSFRITPLGELCANISSVLCSGLVLLFVGLTTAVPARASITINVNYDSSVPVEAQQAFNSVISLYESLISNPVTVNLNVTFGSTGLSESQSSLVEVRYAQWQSALTADAAANPGNTFAADAAASLPSTDPIGTGWVFLTTAEAKALGFNVSLPASIPDGTITFTDSPNMFSYSGAPTAGLYDFMASAAHELDEILGIGSWLTGLPDNSALGGFTPTAEDYFRYGAPGVRSVTTDPNAYVYFSYNGGNTNVAQFNQVNANGDRNDWAYNGCVGTSYVQDAIGCPGTAPALGAAPETIVLSTLGWNLADPVLTGADQADAPEPATLFPCGAAITMLGCGALLRRRPKSALREVAR